MAPKIKNAIIFLSIALIFILIYVFFIKKDEETDALVSSISPSVANTTTVTGSSGTVAAGDFLTLLLNVKNIRLDDAIFSDTAFASLKDSSITLTPDGNEGRPNPFAPIGIDIGAPVSDTQSSTPIASEEESELDLLEQLSNDISESTTVGAGLSN